MLPALPVRSDPWPDDRMQLVQVPAGGGLGLRWLAQPRMHPLRVEFVDGALGHRRLYGGGRQQDLSRACGLHEHPQLSIVDATAGLGRDAFILATLGARVTLLERHPVIHPMLVDGWQRASRAAADADPELAAVLARMSIEALDARAWVPTGAAPQVIYLDPMFPPRDKSAAVKADMQMLHALAGPDTQAEGLLDWALATALCRVVVKRPRRAPPLNDRAPSHQLSGKRNRFDVYTLRRLPG